MFILFNSVHPGQKCVPAGSAEDVIPLLQIENLYLQDTKTWRSEPRKK